MAADPADLVRMRDADPTDAQNLEPRGAEVPHRPAAGRGADAVAVERRRHGIHF